MALTIDKIKNINIPINVSRKPDNYPPSTRGISLYNDSVNLYDAISLFMASAPPATFNIGEGLLGNGSVLSPLSWAGVNHTAALSGNGSVGSPLDVADKGITLSKLAQSGATLNQIIKWDGTNWVAANETGGATSFVPLSRELTINGVTYDLSQNRSWTINSMVYPSAGIPVSTGSAWGTSIVNNSTNWNTAFSWGNHALAGYLTSYTETDPTVPSHVKAITTTNISNWNTAFGWGNHATQGYLTSAAIGVTVQPYNANTVIDGSYVHTDNNYTTAEKSKLAGIQAGAEVNVNADWNAVSGDAQILNKPSIPLVDSVPTSGSTNAVSSGSVFTALSFKADLVGGKVPAIQLPSYVDDVLEGYYNGTSFFMDSTFSTIMTPETGKIYINLLNNTSYRYTGSVYVQISNTVSSLNDLTDVTIGTLNNGQILQYNGTTSQWENISVTIGSGDMQKSVYDIDNDGVVDYSETISVTVRNNSSTDILRRGTIVYLSGSTGNRPNAFKAQANSESTSSGTFGVVVNDIGPNSDGLVAAMGTLHNLDTRTGANGNPNPFTSDTLLDGDILWLDPTTAGYVTKTKPSAPNHAVFIGIVAATSPTNGRIVYKIQNGYEIEELHNVKITAPLLNNQVLRYTQSTGLWENKTLNFQTPLTLNTTPSSGAATLAGDGTLTIPNYTLSGLGGVPTTRTLTINGTSYDLSADRSWTISTASALDDLTDVVVSSPTSGQVLSYDGTNWVNTTGGGGGTPAGNTGEIQFNNAGAFAADSNLFWDNTNKRLGLKNTPTTTFEIKNETTADRGVLGSELLSTSGWTSTGWTGDFTIGFTHSTGNTSTLSNSLAAVTNSYYQLTYTVSNRTAGEFSISFGGVSYTALTTAGNKGLRATSTGNLTVAPTTDFNGTIVVSIKEITEGSAVFNLENSSGAVTNQIKASFFTSNLFVGLNSGNRITTGTSNSGFGTAALRNNTSGINNTAIGFAVLGVNNTGESNTGVGTSALQNNTIGIGNTAVGTSSLSNNVNGASNTAVGVSAISSNSNGGGNTAIGHSALTNNGNGDLNTAIGVNALRGFTTSYQNIGIGADAGYNVTTGKTGTGNILIGYQAGANITSTASNNLVIGKGISLPSATGSDQLVIKNIIFATGTSGTGTTIAGNVGIGISSPNTTALLHLSSTSRGFLQPVMTTTQRDAISATPATGLSIYNSSVGRVQVYNGTTWVDESKYALNRQTASYTLVLSDTGKLVETNVATANTVTVPLNSSQAFEVGARVDIIQYGAGQTTITPTAGVTIRSANGWTKINAQYGAVSLVKIGTDEWYLFGNLNA